MQLFAMHAGGISWGDLIDCNRKIPCVNQAGLEFEKKLAERVGFEPTVVLPTHAFQACALNHSAISPTVYLQALVEVLKLAD